MEVPPLPDLHAFPPPPAPDLRGGWRPIADVLTGASSASGGDGLAKAAVFVRALPVAEIDVRWTDGLVVTAPDLAARVLLSSAALARLRGAVDVIFQGIMTGADMERAITAARHADLLWAALDGWPYTTPERIPRAARRAAASKYVNHVPWLAEKMQVRLLRALALLVAGWARYTHNADTGFQTAAGVGGGGGGRSFFAPRKDPEVTKRMWAHSHLGGFLDLTTDYAALADPAMRDFAVALRDGLKARFLLARAVILHDACARIDDYAEQDARATLGLGECGMREIPRNMVAVGRALAGEFPRLQHAADAGEAARQIKRDLACGDVHPLSLEVEAARARAAAPFHPKGRLTIINYTQHPAWTTPVIDVDVETVDPALAGRLDEAATVHRHHHRNPSRSARGVRVAELPRYDHRPPSSSESESDEGDVLRPMPRYY